MSIFRQAPPPVEDVGRVRRHLRHRRLRGGVAIADHGHRCPAVGNDEQEDDQEGGDDPLHVTAFAPGG
jgi:hypothetical protein